MFLFPIVLSALTSITVHAQDSQKTSALDRCALLIREAVAVEAAKLGKSEPRYQLSEPMPKHLEACFGTLHARGCHDFRVPNAYSFTSSVFEGARGGYVHGSGFVVNVVLNGEDCIFATPEIQWGN